MKANFAAVCMLGAIVMFPLVADCAEAPGPRTSWQEGAADLKAAEKELQQAGKEFTGAAQQDITPVPGQTPPSPEASAQSSREPAAAPDKPKPLSEAQRAPVVTGTRSANATAARDAALIGTPETGYAGTWTDPNNGDTITTVIAPSPPVTATQTYPIFIEPDVSASGWNSNNGYPDWSGTPGNYWPQWPGYPGDGGYLPPPPPPMPGRPYPTPPGPIPPMFNPGAIPSYPPPQAPGYRPLRPQRPPTWQPGPPPAGPGMGQPGLNPNPGWQPGRPPAGIGQPGLNPNPGWQPGQPPAGIGTPPMPPNPGMNPNFRPLPMRPGGNTWHGPMQGGGRGPLFGRGGM